MEKQRIESGIKAFGESLKFVIPIILIPIMVILIIIALITEYIHYDYE